MISKKMAAAINDQINAEYWSAYFYQSISVDLAYKGYAGFAQWFDIQFKEEQLHADMFVKYLVSRGGRVILRPIAEVPTEWKSIVASFEDTLKHEIQVTKLINNLYTLATEEKDYATQSFLKFFIDEQVEEEETAKQFIDNLKMIGDNGYGVFMLDKEAKARVFKGTTAE